MKTKPTQKTTPDQGTKASVPDNETNQSAMKKFVTKQLDKVTIHYGGVDYSYPRRKGAIEITSEQVGEMSESLALLIVLLAGAKKLYLPSDTYFSIRMEFGSI